MVERSARPVVVVTGASAGIGRASAELFARRGARVGLLARGEAGLAGARKSIEDAGGEAIAISTDMANAEQVEVAASTIEEHLGPIDVWVNAAFASVFAPFIEVSAEEFRRVTEVSYLGFVHGTMAALVRMKVRARGTIVQVGSALGARGIPLQSAYCGAKHAINGFTESLRCELLHDKSHVRVTVVQMPAVNTPQFSWVLSSSSLATRSLFLRSISQKSPRGRSSTRRHTALESSTGSEPDRRDTPRPKGHAGPSRPLPRAHGLRLPADRRGVARALRKPVGAG